MSKNHAYEPKHPTDEKHTPVATPPHVEPKTVLITTPVEALKTWQWNGSNHHEHPEWLAEHNIHTHERTLKLDAPQGTISAHKGEWIVKDAKGNVHVTKDAPPSAHPSSASRPSSHQAPETSP